MLSLSQFRRKYTHHINFGLSICRFYEFAENHYDYELDFDVYLKSIDQNLQRPLCWTLLQKQQLILSMLRGIKLPKFVVVQEHGDNEHRDQRILRVIDGKQRFNTIFEFMRGEFPIEFAGENYFFSDLDDGAQREIKNT